MSRFRFWIPATIHGDVEQRRFYPEMDQIIREYRNLCSYFGERLLIGSENATLS